MSRGVMYVRQIVDGQGSHVHETDGGWTGEWLDDWSRVG